MPPDDRLRLHNRHHVQRRWKQAVELHEQKSVSCRPFRLRRNAPARHVQLMPQQHDLGFQACPRPKRIVPTLERRSIAMARPQGLVIYVRRARMGACLIEGLTGQIGNAAVTSLLP